MRLKMSRELLMEKYTRDLECIMGTEKKSKDVNLFWLVHSHASKVLEHDVIIIVSVVGVFVPMTLNRLHLLHCIDTLTVGGAWIKVQEYELENPHRKSFSYSHLEPDSRA